MEVNREHTSNSPIELLDFSDEDSSVYSWTIQSDTTLLKKSDRSVFLHHGSGIPKKIRDFFQIRNIIPGERRPITLWYQNHHYDAFLETTIHDSPRTRIIWKQDFASIIHSKFPQCFDFFRGGGESSDTTPFLQFEARESPNEFNIELVEAGKVDLSFSSPISVYPGEILTNDELMEHFKCSPQGGMRRAHRTKSLVLISDHTKSIYEDRWIDDIFHYTGMGLTGDQSLSFHQNKTLANSKEIDIRVFLFEVFEEGKYVFIGEVELAGEPYVENQPDIKNTIRKVYVFPLKLKGKKSVPPIKSEFIQRKEEEIRRKTKKLSVEELELRAKYSLKGVGKREISTTTYERNQYVAELAKRRANGSCQLCNQPAPFKNIDGEPYLETHHIDWLSAGGQDSIENTTALCPNCHKKMHILNLKSDVAILKSKSSQL